MAPALHVIAGPGPGQLATMAHPADEPWSPPELIALAKAGVQVLVSTTEPGPDTAGIEVVPFPASEQPGQPAPEAKQVVALAIRLARDVRAGRFVVTQAAVDNGRSTLLATMTLALLGIRPGEALRRTAEPGSEIAPDWLHDFVATNS
ncbi:hypothetical protein [Actinoplanes derwentensis]|uniref:Tyrosine phosphatase family protein n=1 Tax=Actinoplanes derwentensis TaxID=113562 RepID=A0A1H2D452_9ACTN|nr:hypothetical protein [Actinoplanes derwentensis]GID87974.1 hypothetical protein Ade03nite_68980 [Actinoplanes derwentensis]SDT77548.1 hypothetical protein SAMN04489716_8005 [Actinoplanes derwentensis]